MCVEVVPLSFLDTLCRLVRFKVYTFMADRVSELLAAQCLCLSTVSSFIEDDPIVERLALHYGVTYVTNQLNGQVCGRRLKS